MRKFLTAALAALTAAGAVMATAIPAEAHDYGRRGYDYGGHHRGSNTAAVAAFAGIAGLALGAALSSDGDRSRRAYSSGYSYQNGYSYDPRYDDYYGSYDSYPRDRVCITRERVWDPYIGRYVSTERRYAC